MSAIPTPTSTIWPCWRSPSDRACSTKRAFEQQKITRADGSQFVLIPDLYFGPNVVLPHGLYVEVEQTVKPEHVTG